MLATGGGSDLRRAWCGLCPAWYFQVMLLGPDTSSPLQWAGGAEMHLSPVPEAAGGLRAEHVQSRAPDAQAGKLQSNPQAPRPLSFFPGFHGARLTSQLWGRLLLGL